MVRIHSTMTAAGLLAAALLLPAALRAHEGHEGKPEAHGARGVKKGFAGDMREKLGISEEQEAKLKAARREKRDASAAAMTGLQASMRRLHDQIEDKAPEKDIAATLDAIAAVRKTMRAEEEKFEAATASILTPTQRAKMMVAMREHGMPGAGMRDEKDAKARGAERREGRDDGDDD